MDEQIWRFHLLNGEHLPAALSYLKYTRKWLWCSRPIRSGNESDHCSNGCVVDVKCNSRVPSKLRWNLSELYNQHHWNHYWISRRDVHPSNTKVGDEICLWRSRRMCQASESFHLLDNGLSWCHSAEDCDNRLLLRHLENVETMQERNCEGVDLLVDGICPLEHGTKKMSRKIEFIVRWMRSKIGAVVVVD